MGNGFRRYVGSRIVVQIDERGFDGTLTRVDRDVIEMEDASFVDDSHGRREAADGTVIVPVSRVAWVQVV